MSPLRSDGSHYGQARGLTSTELAKDAQGRGGKQLFEAKGPSQNRYNDSLKEDQLTLSQGKMKKGEDVADDEDDDAVRTSVSQDQVTETLCNEELFLRTQYI